jgi:hypothetical protein
VDLASSLLPPSAAEGVADASVELEASPIFVVLVVVVVVVYSFFSAPPSVGSPAADFLSAPPSA